MRYQSVALRQLLAGQYVLGTLRGPARRRFERLLREDRSLAREVAAWEKRFAGLQRAFTPQPPRPVVWNGIEMRIGEARALALPPAVPISEDRRPLQLWRMLALAASMAVGALGYALWWALQQPPEVVERVRTVVAPAAPQAAPLVAMLQPDAPMQWLAMVDPQGRRVRISASGSYPLDPATQDLQLWMLDEGGTLHPVALLPLEGGADFGLPMPVNEHCMLAVSLEPKGGSTTGKPTGPVLTTAPLQAF